MIPSNHNISIQYFRRILLCHNAKLYLIPRQANANFIRMKMLRIFYNLLFFNNFVQT